MDTRQLSRGYCSWPRCSSVVCMLLPSLTLLCGCQNDEITTYQAPRSESVATLRVRQRLIAVIIPQDDKMWVVKVLAPEKQVENLLGDFDTLIESVKLSKDESKPISWELPKGWTQEPGNKTRFATLKSPGEQPLEVTVTHLPTSPFLENVNRWRQQIKLAPITEEQAKLITTHPKIDGVDAVRVDMLSATMTPADMKPPGAGMLQGKTDKLSNYHTPEGWKEVAASQFSVVNFVVQVGDEKAGVTVSPLEGKVGSVLANVNRWRDQVLLKPIDEEQLHKELTADKVGGEEAQYVKIFGEEKAILGFIVKRGEQTWFFKMVGPKGLVEKQESVFKGFCRSVEF